MSRKLVELGPREQLEFDIPYEYERAQRAIEILQAEQEAQEYLDECENDEYYEEDAQDEEECDECDDLEMRELFGVGEENRFIGLKAQMFTYISELLGDIDSTQVETYFEKAQLRNIRENFDAGVLCAQKAGEDNLLAIASPIVYLSLYFMVFMEKNYGAKIFAAYGAKWPRNYFYDTLEDVYHYVATMYLKAREGYQFEVELSNGKTFDPLMLTWQCCIIDEQDDDDETRYPWRLSFDFYPWIKLFRQEFGVDLRDYGFRSPYLEAGNADDIEAYLAKRDCVLAPYKLFTCGIYLYTLNEQNEAAIAGATEWPEVLDIPETVDGHTVVAIEAHAFDVTDEEERHSILPSTVPMELVPAKVIEQFVVQTSAHNRIKEVRLPETLREIGSEAFYGNMNLEKINFPRGLQKIDYMAFANTWLPSVRLPKNCDVYHSDDAEVWDIGGAFEACAGIGEDGFECPMEITYYEDEE